MPPVTQLFYPIALLESNDQRRAIKKRCEVLVLGRLHHCNSFRSFHRSTYPTLSWVSRLLQKIYIFRKDDRVLTPLKNITYASTETLYMASSGAKSDSWKKWSLCSSIHRWSSVSTRVHFSSVELPTLHTT